MLDAPPPFPRELTDPAEALRARRLDGLDIFAERALSLGEAFQRKAMEAMERTQGPADAAVATSYGMAFNRTARTYRQIVALEMRLCDKRAVFRERTKDARCAHEDAVAAWEDRRRTSVATRQGEVRDAVEDAIAAGRRPETESDRLLSDLDDLMDETYDELFLTRPIPQIVQDICRSLDVPFDASLWRDEEEAADLAPEPLPAAASP